MDKTMMVSSPKLQGTGTTSLRDTRVNAIQIKIGVKNANVSNVARKDTHNGLVQTNETMVLVHRHHDKTLIIRIRKVLVCILRPI